ncbi:MAG: tetratricopeptide repeat protein, partial [Acidobacteriota bacterium]
SLSFRTDEGDTVQFQAPAFGTLSLMDQIVRAPFRGVDTSYAERFDIEKGTVESDYLFTYVPSWGMMNVLPGPQQAYYLHWTIELDPQHVGLVKDLDTGQYGSVFIVSTEIVPRDEPEKLLVQQRKESFMNLNESQAEKAIHLPFAYSGMTPLAPGSYDARIILRNRACPGRDESGCRKAYTVLQSAIDVPERESGRTGMSEVVLAYAMERPAGAPVYRPYRFGTLQLLPNPRRVYAIGDKVVAAAEALDPPAGAQARFRIASKDAPHRVLLEKTVPVEGFRLEPLVQELSLEGFTGGRYRLTVDLLDAQGSVLDGQTADFDVTPRTSVARPGFRGALSQTRPEIPGLVELALGEQYLSLDQKAKAREYFEGAVARNPKLGPAREHLASLLLEERQPSRVVELLEPVYAEVKDRFEILALLGEAYFQQKDYSRSSELLEKAVVLRRPQARLLNFLAISHYQLGNVSRAREVLERSLAIEPDQPPVKELLEKLQAEGVVSGEHRSP